MIDLRNTVDSHTVSGEDPAYHMSDWIARMAYREIHHLSCTLFLISYSRYNYFLLLQQQFAFESLT
jgi:hypothetical protein